MLRVHRRQQVELWVALGTGRPAATELVFPLPDGSPYPPDQLSRDWGNVVRDRKLPRVMFLPHPTRTHRIAARLDLVTISRRLGHGSPAITLGVYAHVFGETDRAAAQAIDATMRRRLWV
jgi:integrase